MIFSAKSWRKGAKFACFTLISTTLSGCFGVAELSEVERDAFKKDPENIVVPPFYNSANFGDSIKYAYALSEGYFNMSARAARGQDIAALGLIGAAALGAGGVLFGSHSDLWTGAGLGASIIGAGSTYLEPAEASKRLNEASAQLICVIEKAQKVQISDAENAYKFLASEGYDSERLGILAVTIAKIRSNLRKHLERTTPDYLTEARRLVEKSKESLEAEKDMPPPGKITGSLNVLRGESLQNAIVNEPGNVEVLRKYLKALNKKFDEEAQACVISD